MTIGASDAGLGEIVGQSQFYAKGSLDIKDHTQLDIQEGAGSSDGQEPINNSEPKTTRWELWSWYGYAFGNNSAGTLSYAPLIFQSVLNQAGFNGNDPSQDCSDASAPCVVKFGGSNINIATVVLICNGLVFALQGVILICFGSMGDYGGMKRYILIASTLICWGGQFGFLGIKTPSQYQAAIGVYILSSKYLKHQALIYLCADTLIALSYNLCVAFWYPAFPQLAANTPQALEAKRSFEAGEITPEYYDTTKMLQRNRLSNVAFGALSVGYTLTLIIALGAAYGLGANDSDAANLRAAVIIVGLATGVWILFGTPWFFLEKSRTVPLPKGENYFTVGAKTYWQAIRHANRLKQTWLYLIGYFLLSDGYATTNQLYGICQNTIVSYSTTISTGIYIVQGAANAIGILIFWVVQKHYRVKTKTVLIVNMIFLLLMPIWGCIGIGTDKFGLHNTWEVWAFSAIDCAAVAPVYAFSATMLSDLCPKGREVTFFAIYSLVSKSTAWIGPIISGVIIDRTGNTWMGFPFSLALTVVGFILICFVNVEKGQKECEAWVLSDPTLRAVRNETEEL